MQSSYEAEEDSIPYHRYTPDSMTGIFTCPAKCRVTEMRYSGAAALTISSVIVHLKDPYISVANHVGEVSHNFITSTFVSPRSVMAHSKSI